MEVAAVDKRDLDRHVPQLRDGPQATETSADDNDVMTRAGAPRRAIAQLVEVTQAHRKSRPSR
jgi:hypothetical protein